MTYNHVADRVVLWCRRLANLVVSEVGNLNNTVELEDPLSDGLSELHNAQVCCEPDCYQE